MRSIYKIIFFSTIINESRDRLWQRSFFHRQPYTLENRPSIYPDDRKIGIGTRY